MATTYYGTSGDTLVKFAELLEQGSVIDVAGVSMARSGLV